MRRFHALRFTWACKIRGDRRADRKIGAVSKFRQQHQRINVGVVNEIQHCLRSYAMVGIFQQRFDGWQNGFVAGSGKQRNGFLTDSGRGMAQKTANHRMDNALPLGFKQAERVENFFRVRCQDLAGQKVRSRSVQRHRRNLVCCKPVLTDGFPQSPNVLFPSGGNRYQPGADQKQRNPTHLPRADMQICGKNQHGHPGQSIAQTPDHRIDKPFRS